MSAKQSEIEGEENESDEAQSEFDNARDEFIKLSKAFGPSDFFQKCESVATDCETFIEKWPETERGLSLGSLHVRFESLHDESKQSMGDPDRPGFLQSLTRLEHRAADLHESNLEQEIENTCDSLRERDIDFSSQCKSQSGSNRELQNVMTHYTASNGLRFHHTTARETAIGVLGLLSSGVRGRSTSGPTIGLNAPEHLTRLADSRTAADPLFRDIRGRLLKMTQEGSECSAEAEAISDLLGEQQSGMNGLCELVEELNRVRAIRRS